MKMLALCWTSHIFMVSAANWTSSRKLCQQTLANVWCGIWKPGIGRKNNKMCHWCKWILQIERMIFVPLAMQALVPIPKYNFRKQKTSWTKNLRSYCVSVHIRISENNVHFQWRRCSIENRRFTFPRLYLRF